MGRKILGDQLTFVHLEMDKEDKKKRLIGRHDGEGVFVDMLEVYSINTLTHKINMIPDRTLTKLWS